METHNKIYRTKEEQAAYFKQLAFEFEADAHRHNEDPFLYGKAEAYENAAFEIIHNME